MRKMSKFASWLDKYGNVEEDAERHLGRIDWYGHIKINGTYSGSSCMVGNKDSFIAKDLVKDSNPRGSILQEAKNYTDSKVADISTSAAVQQANAYTDTKFTEAKNYTDSKVKYLYYHFITLQGTSGSVYVTYISEYASQYTIATLKNALAFKSLVCSGYLGGVAEYISGEGGNLVVGVRDVTDGSTTGETIDSTFSITDEVTPI